MRNDHISLSKKWFFMINSASICRWKIKVMTVQSNKKSTNAVIGIFINDASRLFALWNR